jgi:CHAT domain-containing protein
LFQDAERTLEQNSGPNSLDLAVSLNNLGATYLAQGKYAEAAQSENRALRIWESVLDAGHPTIAAAQENLGIVYYALGQPDQAEPLFERSFQSLRNQFDQQFAYMSESERLLFRDSIDFRFSIYLSFCFAYRDRKPEVTSKMYDLLLWEKGLVAGSITAQRARIAAGGDKDALAMIDQLKAKKTELAMLSPSQFKDIAEWRKTKGYLEQEANELERVLVARSPGVAEEKRLGRVTWQDVQKALRKEEAAVELVRFRFHDGQEWTDKFYYAALIVTRETKAAPTLVPLGEAKELEGPPINDYRKRVGLEKNAVPDQPSFYTAFWNPLEYALLGKKRIYISPDGVLNQVSLAAVPDDQGKLITEQYDVDVVVSTRDLLRTEPKQTGRTAVLVGNPKFDLTEAEQRLVVKKLFVQGPKEAGAMAASGRAASEEGATPLIAEALRSPVAQGMLSRDDQFGPLDPLPETAKGVSSIRDVLRGRGWEVEDYTEERALEEVVKSVRAPRILHLATHGFFELDQGGVQHDSYPDFPSGSEDPMLRSGLFLAGADRTRKHETVASDLEDGVLTAYEATGLTLQGTEIVTLSACDTGLGRVKGGEGVFGLRRAFQEAGAESVLMSMWSVPATETQELMTLFYKYWLSGKEKHEALHEAQIEERNIVMKRYRRDVPYYWGAWVLVGR